MVNSQSLAAFRKFLSRSSLQGAPDFHVVLGSGFGSALSELDPKASPWQLQGELPFHEVPGIPRATVQDHAGAYRLYRNKKSGGTVVFQLGRIHGYEGHSAQLAVLPVMISRLIGTRRFLLTNAAGGLDTKFQPGDAMLIRDHVNMTGQNPLCGENPVSEDGTPLGPRFPDLSRAWDPAWRASLKTALVGAGLRTHEGIYLGLLGPSFETPSEVELYIRWGMQAVGMSTVWESIALNHSGARVAGLSLISNAACGLGDGKPLEHEKIVETCRVSAGRILAVLLDWLEKEIA